MVGNPSAIEGQTVNATTSRICERDFGRDAKQVCYEFYRSLKSLLTETKCHVRLATNISQVLTIVCFCINSLRVCTVGNPSAIEGQTVNNIKNLRTELWV